MRIVYPKRAINRLQRIRAWIERESPQGAERVIGRIHSAIDLLMDFPELGQESVRKGVRELVVSRTRYIVHYQVRGNRVFILNIRHSAQRPLKS